MTIIAVEENQVELRRLTDAIKAETPQSDIHGFHDIKSALACIQRIGCDVLFTEIILRDGNGLELAKEVMHMNPDVNVIFTAESNVYAGAAFQIYASGYITKPVTNQKVAKELCELRHAAVAQLV